MSGVQRQDTPVHLAAKGGHIDVLHVLLEAQADVNPKDQVLA